MSRTPIVEHHVAQPTGEQLDRVERIAHYLNAEHPEFAAPDIFRPLEALHIDDAPTLQIDDHSAIARLDVNLDSRHYQEGGATPCRRRRSLALCRALIPGYEAYTCSDRLGLGTVEWLQVPPSRGGDASRLAFACWEDRSARRRLIHKFRMGGLRLIHQHMFCYSIWVLAALLHQSGRRPMTVIAPPPGLTQWVNNKVAFAEVVAGLFGLEWRPNTSSACSVAMLSRRVATLAESSRTLGFKLRDSAGGGGNVVVEADRFRNRRLGEIRRLLVDLLAPLRWDGATPLLVSRWEDDVIRHSFATLDFASAARSAGGRRAVRTDRHRSCAGVFQGSTRADLPDSLANELTTRSWLLASVFQRLGYVGRCSFDALLIGSNQHDVRIEFIECNGRWGGTSGPMLLMNRLFGDWAARPYATMECHLDGLDALGFDGLIEGLDDILYDHRTGRGRLIIYAPSQIASRSGLSYVALGRTWTEAIEWARVGVPELIGSLIASRTGRSGRPLPWG